MKIFEFITNIFKPAADLIDAVHTSEEEKLQLKAALLEVQSGVISSVIEAETKRTEAQAAIIMAETKSESWLTRNWRPMVMVSLAASTLAYWFGLTPTDPSTGLSVIPISIIDRMFDLTTIGVGGYIGGRSLEKMAKEVATILKQKDET